MSAPDPQHVAYLTSRAIELQNQAQNLVNGSVGRTDDGQRAFILGYMNLRDQVERLLREAGTSLTVLNELQSPRHRSVVAGQVPRDHLYREIRSEVDTVQQVLDDLLASLASPSASSLVPTPAGVSFIGEQGKQYVYQPDQVLGSGQFSAVYRGFDEAGAAVAVKRLEIRSGRHANADAQQARRELDVARQLAAVPGSHIMPVIDCLEGDGELLLVMPQAQGSLATAIDHDGPLAEAATKELLRQMAVAMQHMATRAVLHRDIKPANILWYDGAWQLADFGVSRILSAATATYTFKGTTTHEYLAPEAWNFGPQSVASDLYALGCVGYEALTGERAFDGSDLSKQLHETHHPKLPADIDPVLVKVINQLLAKNPDARPPDARRVIELLVPRAGLSAGQQALQQFTALSAMRERQRETLNAAGVVRHERRARARVALDTFWNELVAYAREADPEIDAHAVHESAYAMAVGEARLRLNVDDNPPGFDTDVLLVAELLASMTGVDKRVLFAHLVCRWQGERPVWCLGPSPAADLSAAVTMRSLYEHEDTAEMPSLGDLPSPASPDDVIDLFARAATSLGSRAQPSEPA